MKQSRRKFLGQAAAAVTAPMIVPASVFGRPGRPAPGDRITMGLIGCGGMGFSNLGAFLGKGEVQVVAVCDVDEIRETKQKNRSGRVAGKEIVEKHYAKDKESGAYKGCDMYKDYRELCARKDIQAVIVATPDHWHALASMEALKNGKDVYCEKPITHLFAEGRAIANEVEKRKAVWQTGSQQRSEFNFRRAAAIVRNGLIGKLKHVDVGLPTGHKIAQGDAKVGEPPATLDYDFWCGPSPKLPYIPGRLHFHWRWNLAYGGGQLMDWIGHHNDIAHWGMNMDNDGPVEVEASGFTWADDKTLYDAPVDYEVRCAYASGATSRISNRQEMGSSHKENMGTQWTGTDGWVYVTRGKIEASNPEWLKKDFDPGPTKLYTSDDHRRNFLDCVKSREKAIAHAEISHRSITPGHLAYASLAAGKKLKWDPKTETCDDEAAQKKLTTINYRGDWKL
jgi:predicted dehydrogenase